MVDGIHSTARARLIGFGTQSSKSPLDSSGTFCMAENAVIATTGVNCPPVAGSLRS